jgi:CBS domain containing-hemolysin-like protein
MTLETKLAIAGIALCAGASFFFALAESALFSLGKWRAQKLAEGSERRGKEVLTLLEDAPSLLASIVLGNTLANAGLVFTALYLALEGNLPMGWTLGGTLALVLVGCEVVPKTLAVRAAEAWSLRISGLMSLFHRFTQWPRRLAQDGTNRLLRWVIPKSWVPQTGLTDEEYQELLELAYQQGTLAKSERDIILQIITLDRRTVKDAMKPRSQMACISDDLSIEEMIEAARRFKHQRLPMYDETPDTIVGILNTRTLLLDPDAGLEEAVEFPSFVPETMNLLQLFRSFQRQQRGLAIVLDEFGGTAGLVTMEDILEEVIGEIETEGRSRAGTVERLDPDRWRMSATLRIDDFRREYPGLAETHAAETMGGLLLDELGVVPAKGEWAVVDGLRLTALEVDERRVRLLLVEVVKRRRGTSAPDGSAGTDTAMATQPERLPPA